jgi:hypothetical protein
MFEMDWQKGGAVLVSLVVTAGFIGAVGIFLFRPPTISGDIAAGLMLALTTNFTTVVNYWMGTSISSAKKDETIANLSGNGKH